MFLDNAFSNQREDDSSCKLLKSVVLKRIRGKRHTQTRTYGSQTCGNAQSTREVSNQNDDSGREDSSHREARQNTLNKEKLPPLRAEACQNQTGEESNTTSGATNAEMSLVDERTNEESHEENSEDLKRTNPRNLRWRHVRQENILVICLEDSERLDTISVQL